MASHHNPRIFRSEHHRNPRRCKYCVRKIPADRETCVLCGGLLKLIDSTLEMYLTGMPPAEIDKGVAEFDRLFHSNTRLRVFYNSACEVLDRIWDKPNPNIPIELEEPLKSASIHIPIGKVLKVLEESKIIEIKPRAGSPEGFDIWVGSIVTKMMRIRLSQIQLSDQESQLHKRVIYAILTLTITKTLLQDQIFRPQTILALLRVLTAHISNNADSTDVSNQLKRTTWQSGFKGVSADERSNIEREVLGFSVFGEPRIFADRQDNDVLILKDEMIPLLTYWRSRLHEREVERLH